MRSDMVEIQSHAGANYHPIRQHPAPAGDIGALLAAPKKTRIEVIPTKPIPMAMPIEHSMELCHRPRLADVQKGGTYE